jgi:Xaa-Pro dipeptidase
MIGETQQTVSATSAIDLLNSVSSSDERSAERKEKWSRVADLLDRKKLAAILIRTNENIAWVTAGQVEMRVAIPTGTGTSTLLLTRDGRKYYLTTNNEAARLSDEEFPGLGYEPIVAPWYQNDIPGSIRHIVSEGTIGTDLDLPGLTTVDLTSLRAPLTTGEIARFRWLASHAADVTAQTLLELEPGITEDEMAARVAARLITQGILPSVLLMAVDDRIRKYKHAVARGTVLEHYGMLNLCARKWGLVVSITRFVHFGAAPQQLIDGFAACAEVNAKLLHASRSGVSSARLFAVAERAYSDAGFAGEEQLHHQGGPAGYLEREWVASPGGLQILAKTEALAWNPSIRGAKIEDTALLQDDVIEVLTQTPALPQIHTTVDGITYPATDVLIR